MFKTPTRYHFHFPQVQSRTFLGIRFLIGYLCLASPLVIIIIPLPRYQLHVEKFCHIFVDSVQSIERVIHSISKYNDILRFYSA